MLRGPDLKSWQSTVRCSGPDGDAALGHDVWPSPVFLDSSLAPLRKRSKLVLQTITWWSADAEEKKSPSGAKAHALAADSWPWMWQFLIAVHIRVGERCFADPRLARARVRGATEQTILLGAGAP
eukprot:scaffold4472_cov37-Tisochrysis_lutea.AAC.2